MANSESVLLQESWMHEAKELIDVDDLFELCWNQMAKGGSREEVAGARRPFRPRPSRRGETRYVAAHAAISRDDAARDGTRPSSYIAPQLPRCSQGCRRGRV